MKVVLFCGGLGTRLQAYSDTIPKPMVSIGTRPMLWHLMRYYAHFGHTEFILCLGYRGDVVRRYFDDELGATPEGEVRSEDGGASWRLTLVDTGLTANIGQQFVRSHARGLASSQHDGGNARRKLNLELAFARRGPRGNFRQ